MGCLKKQFKSDRIASRNAFERVENVFNDKICTHFPLHQSRKHDQISLFLSKLYSLWIIDKNEDGSLQLMICRISVYFSFPFC